MANLSIRKKSAATAASILLLLVLPVILPFAVNAQQTHIFKITMIVPQPNQARQAWSLLVKANLESMGIEVGRVVLDFGTVGSRTFQPDPSVVKKAYDQGGYDILFVGYGLQIDADPWSIYHSSQFAPAGQNFYYWNNSQNDQLTTQIKETVDKPTRLALVRQWQELAADELPSIPIFYSREIVAHSATIANGESIFFDYHFPAWPSIEHISMTTDTAGDTLILAQTGPAPDEGLIPILSLSYYDATAFTPLYNGLAARNDTTKKTMIPALASGWTVATDNKTWTVNLRTGVTFHDGNAFDSTDVKFTFDAVQDPDVGSPVQAFYEGIIGGKANVVVVDADTVQFNLPTPYAYFVENILTLPILPSHILGPIPEADWDTSSFNTGQGSGPFPVGTGPYEWDSYDSATETVKLKKRTDSSNVPDYFDFPDKGKAALELKGQYEVENFHVRHMAGTDAAITAFKGNTVHVLDSQYHLETVPSFLADIGPSRWVDYDAFGVQEISVNMAHPILGTGVDTPMGRQDPSKAAQAAKLVRQAISSAVPRHEIIGQLLNGYGVPAITTPVIGNYLTGVAQTEGFNTNLRPYNFNLTKSREVLIQAGYNPLTVTPPGFWETYGLYITAALIAAVVVIALYFYKIRKPSMQTASMPTTSASP